MTTDPTRPPRVTKQELRPAAGEVEALAGVRRKDCREPHSMLV
jgi:hypothetical protein